MSTSTHSVRETFAVAIDPSVRLAEQIRCGNYVYVNASIKPKNFTLTLPAGEREVVLFDPHGYASSDEVIACMKRDEYVPATLDDALAFGATYPDRQRRNPIVFLGTMWRSPGGNGIPMLSVRRRGRVLNLGWFEYNWYNHCRFAAVRES